MSGQRKSGGRVGRISERDLEIYRLARSGTRTQRELAAEFQLSGPRIHAILARVHDLLGRQEKASETSRRERLEVVRARHIERLETLYVETLQAWEDSHRPQVSIRMQEINGEVVSVTRTTITRPGDRRWLADARKIACELAAFRSQGRVADAGVIDSHVVEPSPAADRWPSRANIEQIILDRSEVSAK